MSDPHGQWIREPKTHSAVVFVHGILSSGDTGWRSGDTYWPELLSREEPTAEVGIYVFSYRADALAAGYSLGDAVEALNAYLRLDKLLDLRNLIFVCHSMGGIVVRQFLVTRQAALIDKDIHVGLFLIASPSLGSDYANLFLALAKALGNSQAQALRFADNNAWLNDLDRNFMNLKESNRLFIRGQELVEDEFIVLRAFLRRQVVRPFSGARYFGESLKIPNSNHFTIAKPVSRDALQHRLLVQFIVEFIQASFAKENRTEPSGSVAGYLREELEEIKANPPLSVGERSTAEWLDDLLGLDPVAGSRAVKQISSDPEPYMPLLKEVLFQRGFNLQLSHRMPIVFGNAGTSGIDTLLLVLNSNQWEAMERAAECFKYVPEHLGAVKIAELITDLTSRIDVTRRAFEALGWMGATLYRSKIWHAAMGSDEYAFEKLSFFAYRAFILMTVNSHDQHDASRSMKLISDLLRYSEGEKHFVEGYDVEREWQDQTHRLTPQAEDALLEWLDGADAALRDLALIAYSRSRNPRLLRRMLKALATATSPKQKVDVGEYLQTQDTEEGRVAAGQLLNDHEYSGYGLAMLSCMMYRLGDEEANAVLAKINHELYPRRRVQALYTLGRPVSKLAFASDLFDDDDEVTRGAAAVALASRLGIDARQAVQERQPHAANPIERALMCAAAVRCRVEGSSDALHAAMAQISNPFLLGYLWRRELVFAVSREGPDAKERGQAWGELFNVNFQLTEEEVNRFAPCPSKGSNK